MIYLIYKISPFYKAYSYDFQSAFNMFRIHYLSVILEILTLLVRHCKPELQAHICKIFHVK